MDKEKIDNKRNSQCVPNSVYTPIQPPENTILPEGVDAEEAYRILTTESLFNSRPDLNLASFVTTFMDPQGTESMVDTININYVDKLIYPQVIQLEQYCVSMLANLYNANSYDNPFGVSTIGSTEAALLAGLNYKFKWYEINQNRQCATPEIILGSNVQVCWYKFARYFQVKPIIIPTDSNSRINVDLVKQNLNNNTICIVGVLGNTFTGDFDDIQALNNIVNDFNICNDWKIPIHVDAASGGFIAPFYEPYSNIPWDFRLEWVKSINVSGHKYGLVYPGLGWGIWRNKNDIDPQLIFSIDYLGGNEVDFSLNFSKNANNVIGQYYNFTRLGRKGYTNIVNYLFSIQQIIQNRLTAYNYKGHQIFEVFNNKPDLPVTALTLTEQGKRLGLTTMEISKNMQRFGWSIPAYPLPKPLESVNVLRMVLRVGFNSNMVQKLGDDLIGTVEYIIKKNYR